MEEILNLKGKIFHRVNDGVNFNSLKNEKCSVKILTNLKEILTPWIRKTSCRVKQLKLYTRRFVILFLWSKFLINP